MLVKHSLKPVYDENSEVLILGTMPSVKSREIGFYYAHPKNRFWKTLENVFDEEIGSLVEDKIKFLLKHHIALFDVLKSCDINSSSDNSIKNPVPNDINKLIKKSNIKTIFTTGKKAFELYKKYCEPQTHIEAICLPSTSPANCPKGIDKKLYDAYYEIRNVLENK